MMSDSFLPAMREKVARRLSTSGQSQGKIASLLGVTQASVSLYLKKPGRSKELLQRLGISEEEGELYAALLAEDLLKSPLYAVSTLYSLWADALGRGALCASHRQANASLAECDMCIRRFSPGKAPGADAIKQVTEAVSLLEGSSIFGRVMPEVSVNIAYAPEGASAPEQVVAVPGRIVKVKGVPRSFMRPEYGASTHVARVLLTVISHDKSVRAAINLRYDERMANVLHSLRISHLTIPESSKRRSDAALLEELSRELRSAGTPIVAVVDEGGAGIEPELYLFAADPVAVAQLGLKVARSYVGGLARLVG